MDARGSASWRPIVAFLALAFGISWSIDLGLRGAGVPFVVRVAPAMFGPALAAYLVRGPLFRIGFEDAGLRPNLRSAWRTYVAAYVAVPLALAVGAFVAVAARVQSFAPRQNLLWLLAQTGTHGRRAPSGHDATHVVLFGALTALSLAIPINVVFAFGEEFGWRGFLLPRLSETIGRARAVVVVGVVWGLWHAPLVVLDGYEYAAAPVVALPLTLVLFVVLSAAFAALRFASRSIWPSTIAHAALNAQASVVFVALVPRSSTIGAPVGVVGMLAFALVSVVLWKTLPRDVQA